MQTRFAHYILVALCTLAIDAAHAADRPTMQAYRVADGAVKIDGKLDEWPSMGLGYTKVAVDLDHSLYNAPQRGAWMGPVDFSFSAQAAVDSDTLYVGATINDQILINEGGPADPWVGDDFELFIDASSPDARFHQGTNDNTLQFMFVPEHLWNGTKGTFVWNAKNYPGVTAVSRLTPTGYTIEVAIPKDTIPNWKAHHDLDSVGFDILVGDLDNRGAVGHDAGPKALLYLLQPDQHFKNAAKLGLLSFDTQPTAFAGTHVAERTFSPDYNKAQRILDNIDGRHAERDANAALTETGLARQAALFVLYRRPELKADTKKLIALLAETPTGPDALLLDPREYAILALAERHQLPVDEVFDRFATSDDLVLRHTAIYCLGMNGDKTVVPELAKLYGASTGLTQEFVAMALGELGDATGAPTLKMSLTRDKGQWFAIHCAELLAKLR